jgi:uncharacterized repeat protein (TIGR03803 family)
MERFLVSGMCPPLVAVLLTFVVATYPSATGLSAASASRSGPIAARARIPSAETLLYSFLGPPDGYDPMSGVIADGTGALYGSTFLGGLAGTGCAGGGCGTIFKLRPSSSGYVESIIHRFHGTDGAEPNGLLSRSNGVFFGTTFAGSASLRGTVFELTPARSGYREKILHSFTGPPNDGENPLAGLISDNAGALYGTTQYGGGGSLGTVFKLTPAGGGYAESVLSRMRQMNA